MMAGITVGTKKARNETNDDEIINKQQIASFTFLPLV